MYEPPELTVTEERVLAIILACGRVNREEFNTACNVDDLNKMARDRALDGLREKGLVPRTALDGNIDMHMEYNG